MFSGKHELKAADGVVFLDRNPRIFDMVLDYLRHDGDYFPKDVDDETKNLFIMEINHWGVSEKLIEKKMPYFLIDMLKEKPKADVSRPKQMVALEKWIELGPLSLQEIHAHNNITFDQSLHYEINQTGESLYEGQLNKQGINQGVGRQFYNTA